jgi:hypothetical protein
MNEKGSCPTQAFSKSVGFNAYRSEIEPYCVPLTQEFPLQNLRVHYQNKCTEGWALIPKSGLQIYLHFRLPGSYTKTGQSVQVETIKADIRHQAQLDRLSIREEVREIVGDSWFTALTFSQCEQQLDTYLRTLLRPVRVINRCRFVQIQAYGRTLGRQRPSRFSPAIID